jgi:hypothetical protein
MPVSKHGLLSRYSSFNLDYVSVILYTCFCYISDHTSSILQLFNACYGSGMYVRYKYILIFSLASRPILVAIRPFTCSPLLICHGVCDLMKHHYGSQASDPMKMAIARLKSKC